GNLRSVTDRNGRVIRYVRDNLDRVTDEKWYNTVADFNNDVIARTLHYTYNKMGWVHTVTDPNTNYTYDYDAQGRVIEMDNASPGVPATTMTARYDPVDQREADFSVNGIGSYIQKYDYDFLDNLSYQQQS